MLSGVTTHAMKCNAAFKVALLASIPATDAVNPVVVIEGAYNLFYETDTEARVPLWHRQTARLV